MLRFFRRAPVAVLLGFASTGAVADAAHVAGAAQSPAPVVLLGAGTAPRAPLRLDLTSGSASHTEMELPESLRQVVDGQVAGSVSTPPIRLPIDAQVSGVSKDGVARVESSYGEVVVVDDGTVRPDAQAQLKAALAPISDIVTTAEVTPRNQWRDAHVSGTEALGSAAAPLVEQLTGQLGGLSVPFPARAVGIGARWRTTTSLRAEGIRVKQTYDFTLEAHDGTDVTLDVDFVQTAPSQHANLPGVPKRARVDVTRYRVTGSGTVTLDLSHVLPAGGSTHASGVQVFRVREGGKAQTLTQHVAIDVSYTQSAGGDGVTA